MRFIMKFSYFYFLKEKVYSKKKKKKTNLDGFDGNICLGYRRTQKKPLAYMIDVCRFVRLSVHPSVYLSVCRSGLLIINCD